MEREVGGRGIGSEKCRKEQKSAFQPEKRARAHEQRRRRASAISIGLRAGASCESREAKSMREESSSEEDCDEPVEWEDDDEVASEEDGSEKCQRRRLSRAPATPPV